MARRTKRPPAAGANHLEWLRLVEVSGPFLSLPVLKEALPQGLEADDRDVRAELKSAHSEWTETAHDRAYHTQWIRFVLGRALELGSEVLVDGPGVPANLRVRVAVHHEDLRPDFAVLGLAESGERPTRLVVQVFDAGTDLERPVDDARWKASPVTRMVELLRGFPDGGPTLGLVTNGEQWVLVSAPRKGTTTFVTWHASLWFEEKITLQALRTLLGARRVFGPVDETLERLIERSAEHQHDVTIQLGLQVREAIELLVRRIDEIDRGSGRTLLEGVTEKQVYEAAVTVMMRLVFVFYLEEQADLYFPVAKSNFYQRHYALSPLGASLRAEADRLGSDVLERRTSAWCRLLATFRAIHGGVAHVDMRLPAYGGHLFDPDRFPFLEGRKPGQGWRTNAAAPLAIDDATVLFVLEALQVLRVRESGANGAETRRLSFRELGVEQIGNVYESLLDHTAKRAADAVVSLKASKGEEPEIELRELEQCYDPIDTSKLVSFVKERTGRTEPSIAKDLEYTIEDDPSRWLVACGNDAELYGRVKPIAGLVREDRRKQPVVYPKDGIYVTAGADRRSTGTHYTPPSLTEPVVRYALEPLVYVGPAEGKPESEWVLKSAREILALRVCDLACGSGAFLVQACRYLADRLVEAWTLLEAANPGRLLITPEGDLSTGAAGERIIPKDAIERQAIARRVVADRCLYGVDINPMAVEMAKLSLWLTTLQREKPFGFLDHSIRWGDSLLGVTNAWHLTRLSLTDSSAQLVLGSESLTAALQRASALRNRLEALSTETVRDVEEKAQLLATAEAELSALRAIADGVVAAYLDACLEPAARRDRKLSTNLKQDLSAEALEILDPSGSSSERLCAADACSQRAAGVLRRASPAHAPIRRPLHWLLEFPEVFGAGVGRHGFSVLVGNPPFVGGRRIRRSFGDAYIEYLGAVFPAFSKNADYSALLLQRAVSLASGDAVCGYIGPASWAQGDTRESLIEPLLRTCTVVRADTGIPWPGDASVIVNRVWIAMGASLARRILNGEHVPRIGATFTASEARPEPRSLPQMCELIYQGVVMAGDGFKLSVNEAATIISRSPDEQRFLRLAIGGEEVTQYPVPTAKDWIIDFTDMPESVLTAAPLCAAIVRERVKPERDTANREAHRRKYWRFGDERRELRAKLNGLARALVIPELSRYHIVQWAPIKLLFLQQLRIVPVDSAEWFALLQSSIHEVWARRDGVAKMGSTPRYVPSFAFETFPVPSNMELLAEAGKTYWDARHEVLTRLGIGPAELYARVSDATCREADVARLREIIVANDERVVQSYEANCTLSHAFIETGYGVRFMVSQNARGQILDFLSERNRSRHAAKVEEESSARS